MSLLDRPTAASIALRRDAHCPHSVLADCALLTLTESMTVREAFGVLGYFCMKRVKTLLKETGAVFGTQRL